MHEKIARKAGESQEIVEAIMSDYVHFADAFMRILQRTAEAKIPAGSDLNILRDALNLPILYLDYRGFLAKRYGEQPYAAHGKSAVRVAAEALLQYLNMTDGPGPVHSGCRVCGLLMIRKRGGRKYCSTKCSGTAWSYEARKEKLAENRKIHRQRAARELAAINSSKSTAIKKKGA
jgi:hypothetical protein